MTPMPADPNKLAPVPIRKSDERIIRVGPDHYEMPCSVCGKIAFLFRLGMPVNSSGPRMQATDWNSSAKCLTYSGVTGTTCHYDISKAEKVLAALGTGSPAMVHAAFVEINHEGIDAYCPECDAIFCEKHYRQELIFDDGFLDCTYGTCPKGHRRMIDD